MLNKAIIEIYDSLKKFLKKELLNSKFDLKAEIISTTLYENMNDKTKKIQISLQSLGTFLQILNAKKNKNEAINFSKYNIFSLFEDITNNIKVDIRAYGSQKLIIFIDYKFLADPSKFIKNFTTELKVAPDDVRKESEIIRCAKCNLMLPNCLVIKPENQNKNYVKDRCKNTTLSINAIKDLCIIL